MCNAHVMHTVKQRIEREGAPSVSRRNFLRLGGIGAAGLAAAAGGLSLRQVNAQEMRQVVDLSHIFAVNAPTYVPSDVPTRETSVTVEEDGFYIQRWSFGEHTGTHVDIPAHFIADGETVDNYAPELLVSTAVIIDIAAKADADSDAELTVEDIQAWEAANGEIAPGALVCMYSGWESRWNDVAAFRNADDDGVMHFPGFHPDAAAFLIEERDIHGIAVDTLSLDNGPSATFDVHYTILGAGKYGIEGVANLALLKDTQATVILGVPRWEAGSGGPCRVLALL